MGFSFKRTEVVGTDFITREEFTVSPNIPTIKEPAEHYPKYDSHASNCLNL